METYIAHNAWIPSAILVGQLVGPIHTFNNAVLFCFLDAFVPKFATSSMARVKHYVDRGAGFTNSTPGPANSIVKRTRNGGSLIRYATTALTTNCTILHLITLVRFAVNLVDSLTDGVRSAAIPQAGIMADAAHNGFPEGKTLSQDSLI